jgi:hypothetical protein
MPISSAGYKQVGEIGKTYETAEYNDRLRRKFRTVSGIRFIAGRICGG